MTLAYKVQTLENFPPKVVTKKVEVIKEKEKCQKCTVKQLEKEKSTLKFQNTDLSIKLDDTKNNNKLLVLFGVIATISSIYRDESILNELNPIKNWLLSIYNEYSHITEVSLLSANSIDNIILKILAIIGVTILCSGVGASVFGLIAYLIGEHIAPFIENHFDKITNLVFFVSLSVVIFIGGELKVFIPSPIGEMNIFLLWIVSFVIFLVSKCTIEKINWHKRFHQ